MRTALDLMVEMDLFPGLPMMILSLYVQQHRLVRDLLLLAQIQLPCCLCLASEIRWGFGSALLLMLSPLSKAQAAPFAMMGSLSPSRLLPFQSISAQASLKSNYETEDGGLEVDESLTILFNTSA